MGAATNSTTGEIQTMQNPLIQSTARANAVAEWVKDCLANRKTLSGNYQGRPALGRIDKVTVEENKYAYKHVL